MQSHKTNDRSEVSFSIVEDDNFNFDETISVNNARDIPSPVMSDTEDIHSIQLRRKVMATHLTDSDSDEEQLEVFTSRLNEHPQRSTRGTTRLPRQASSSARPTSAGPSAGQSAVTSRSPVFLDLQKPPQNLVPVDTDSDESDEIKLNKLNIPGEYDASQFDNLIVNDEIKDLFQYITKYIPQNLQLDCKFKPFIPEHLPAVGDIDAFLKVLPPETTLTGKSFNSDDFQLGIVVLDEPVANQSDPALLNLQLRATSINISSNANIVVKKVENIDKNVKIIDKWIKDVTDLHKTKSSPVVRYSDPMPDLDDLMQEWPANIENLLKFYGFPSWKLNGSISKYIDIVCCMFDIPVYKNKIQSLHLLFCLYAAIRNSQLYQANTGEVSKDTYADENGEKSTSTDQLVLD